MRIRRRRDLHTCTEEEFWRDANGVSKGTIAGIKNAAVVITTSPTLEERHGQQTHCHANDHASTHSCSNESHMLMRATVMDNGSSSSSCKLCSSTAAILSSLFAAARWYSGSRSGTWWSLHEELDCWLWSCWTRMLGVELQTTNWKKDQGKQAREREKDYKEDCRWDDCQLSSRRQRWEAGTET